MAYTFHRDCDNVLTVRKNGRYVGCVIGNPDRNWPGMLWANSKNGSFADTPVKIAERFINYIKSEKRAW